MRCRRPLVQSVRNAPVATGTPLIYTYIKGKPLPSRVRVVRSCQLVGLIIARHPVAAWGVLRAGTGLRGRSRHSRRRAGPRRGECSPSHRRDDADGCADGTRGSPAWRHVQRRANVRQTNGRDGSILQAPLGRDGWKCSGLGAMRFLEELAKLDVELNRDKTRRVDLAKGESFTFLGFEFRRVKTRQGKWGVKQGQFLFEPPTGPVLVQPIDRPPIFRSTQPNLMANCGSG